MSAPVEAPLDAKVAAVGREPRLVEDDVVAVDVNVQRARRLDAHALERGLAVRSLDGTGDGQPQLGQEDVDGGRLPGVEVDGHPAGRDPAPVAQRRQLGGQHVQLQAPKRDASVHGGPGRGQRRLGVQVEPIEELAVNGDARRVRPPDA